MKRGLAALALLACALRCGAADAAEVERNFDYGEPFGTVSLYLPEGVPKSVVLFLSGDAGWQLGVVDMARHLRAAGAAVAGVDTVHYLRAIAAAKSGNCRYLAADLEALGHRVQREMQLADYQVPLLYGYSSGANVAYAALVQSPPGTFAGALSLGFCPEQKFGGVALCAGTGAQLHYEPGQNGAWVLDPATSLSDRWVVFAGLADKTCPAAAVDVFAAHVGHAEVVHLPSVGHGYGNEPQWLPQFQQTFASLAQLRERPVIADAEVADLPLIEQRSTGPPSAPLVVLLTGDGGWAGLDRGLAQAFNQRGLSVVALNTLKYFWRLRTPEESAADVGRLIRHYLTSWKRERVLLVGYSFGADVLPFITNRLPPELRARVISVSMLGLELNASFEIHVTGWVPGVDTGSAPIKPELAKMQGVNALCLYGADERHDPCPMLAGGSLRARQIGGGHHFGGDYEALAAAILAPIGSGAAGERPSR